MLKKIIFVIGFLFTLSSLASGFKDPLTNFCPHGGCDEPSKVYKTYDCWYSGAEFPDATLIKYNNNIDDGTMTLIALGNTPYFQGQLEEFSDLSNSKWPNSSVELDLLNENEICSSASGNCLNIKHADVGTKSAQFVLSIKNGSFGSASFQCKAN